MGSGRPKCREWMPAGRSREQRGAMATAPFGDSRGSRACVRSLGRARRSEESPEWGEGEETGQEPVQPVRSRRGVARVVLFLAAERGEHRIARLAVRAAATLYPEAAAGRTLDHFERLRH